MGACSSCVCSNREQSLEDFHRAIDYENRYVINWYVSSRFLRSIDEEFCSSDGISLNPLSYALVLGRLRSFEFIHSKMGGSMEIMEQKLEKQGQSGLNLICRLGYNKLLEYTLPFYEERLRNRQVKSMRMTLDFNSLLAVPSRELSPVMTACSLGHLKILKLLHKHGNETNTPSALNIHARDDTSGENCAFIACKRGNLEMVKFLHEECKADFNIINKRHENCVHVLLSRNRKSYKKTFYSCLVYLINKIGIDLSYKYEESLLLAEGHKLVNFIERKLADKGIRTSKREIERDNMIMGAMLIDDCKYTFKQQIDTDSDFSVVSRISSEPYTPFDCPIKFEQII